MAKLSTWEVLRNKYPATEYVLLAEVSDASGYSRSRSLDYMVVNLWQSRGLAVTGIEKKSHRGDWLKELKTPAKQENHFKHCDYFYLLTDNENVAKIEEIPDTWGWLHINEKGILKTMKAAPKLVSLPIDRSLMCAMLRRAADKEKYVHIDTLETEITARVNRAVENKNRDRDYKVKDYETLLTKVQEFEKASGISVRNAWELGSVGEAVKIITRGGTKSYQEQLERLETQAKGIYERLVRDLDAIKNISNEIQKEENLSEDR